MKLEGSISNTAVNRNYLLRDMVIGMSDGLTVPFALAAGLSVVAETNNIIVIAGILAIGGGAITMGFSGYYSRRNEQLEQQKQNNQQLSLGNKNFEETKAFFAALGLSEALQEKVATEIEKDKDTWEKNLQKYQNDTSQVPPGALRSAWNICFSYILGGLIAIAPFKFASSPENALKYAVVIAVILLFILGWLKGKLSGAPPFSAAIRMMLIGAIAAASAYTVAKILASM
ncbi:MAG: VIT1/CCC1 transporter family protein [Flavisolibacter sp.]|nr:VIT1/CCC1 transporter family protein [Flavisolibacter sp.]